MSRRVDFYTVAIYSNETKTDYSVGDFLETLGRELFNKNHRGDTTRNIEGRKIRLFSYYYSLNRRQIVLPFGKDKGNNKPYGVDNNDNLEEIPRELYDVNSLGYDYDYNLMIFTTNREGPTIGNVQDYLNSCIPNNIGLKLRIAPIKYNTGIDKVRNAAIVKSVTFSLDLGQPLNEFYLGEIETNKHNQLISSFKNIAESARNDGESKTLSLTMGLGRGNRKGSLNVESMLLLLEQINIDARFVKEINVAYKNGTEDTIDIARLKNSQMILYYTCKCDETQVTPQALLNNFNDAIANRITNIIRSMRDFNKDMQICNLKNFNIVVNTHKK
ncbi:MAG: DUF6731 family protein [Lachnospira sp.]